MQYNKDVNGKYCAGVDDDDDDEDEDEDDLSVYIPGVTQDLE